MQVGDKVSGCIVKVKGRSVSFTAKEGILEYLGVKTSTINVRGKRFTVLTETLRSLSDKNFLTQQVVGEKQQND